MSAIALHKLRIQTRLLLAFTVAGIASLFMPQQISWLTRLLFSWDVAMFCLLSLTWWAMVKATPASMRKAAQREDPGRILILSAITIAAVFSLLAIVFMLRSNKNAPPEILTLHFLLSFSTIIGSWLLVHTIFALHYAHGYYNDDTKTLQEAQAEELDFPGDIDPDYWDFMYFSFVVGMTSQVSDVEVASRSLRRLALLHGVLSFFFNTTILAMGINLFAGLIQGAN